MTNSFGVDIGQKFPKYAKNKWILRWSNLSKESIYDPSGQLILEFGTSLEKEILISEKIVHFAASTALPVEISSGNTLQFLKEGYLRHTTQKI